MVKCTWRNLKAKKRGSPPAGGAYIALFQLDRTINSAAWTGAHTPGAMNTLTQQLGYSLLIYPLFRQQAKNTLVIHMNKSRIKVNIFNLNWQKCLSRYHNVWRGQCCYNPFSAVLLETLRANSVSHWVVYLHYSHSGEVMRGSNLCV